jgi:hypothetical protein
MWSLSFLTWLFSLFSLSSNWLSYSATFSENDGIPYKVYHLMYVTKLSCTCRKRIKGRRKQKKQKLDKKKVKRENKINIIIYTWIYLPGNGAKNLTLLKDWCLIPSSRVSK